MYDGFFLSLLLETVSLAGFPHSVGNGVVHVMTIFLESDISNG